MLSKCSRKWVQVIALGLLCGAIELAAGQENLTVVLPYEGYEEGRLGEVSYVIENKRYIDSAPFRCLQSTAMGEEQAELEPSFALIHEQGETWMNATVAGERILEAGFEPDKRTLIIVHGWTQSYPETNWLVRARDVFRENNLVGKENLFFMDYRAVSLGSYRRAAGLSSSMGAYLAHFATKLTELGQDPLGIHLIGHSLGGPVIAFAGKRFIEPKLGRITSIDPAGPCFGAVLDNGPEDRLGPNDAQMVDVLHYDTDFLGSPYPLGHFDVYINGGHTQPGTNENLPQQLLDFVIGGSIDHISGDHDLAAEVTTTQLSSLGCQQMAFECSSYAAFERGECATCNESNDQCHLMDLEYQHGDFEPLPLRKPNRTQKMYIRTSSQEPYCLQHYQILVELEPAAGFLSQLARRLWRVQFEAPSGFSNITMTNQKEANLFTHLHLAELLERPVRVSSARMRVARLGAGSALESSAYNVSRVEVNFMSHVEFQERKSFSSRLCVPGGAAGSDADGWLQLEQCR